MKSADCSQRFPIAPTPDIIFLGDNGSIGSVIQPPYPSSRDKQTLYEGGTHVPLIISGPSVVNPNRTNDSLVNMVDIYSTILELAGSSVSNVVPPNVTIDGQSLLPMLQTTNTYARYSYSELFGSGVTPSSACGQTLKNTQYKLIHFYDHHDEFYDLQNDPYEAVNLLASPMSPTAQSNYYGLLMKLAGYTTLAQPTITPTFNAGQFTATVPLANLNYTLWRAAVLDDYAWAPQTSASVVTNGSTVTLTDTNIIPQGFYRVVGSLP